ncbi:MAG: transketolase [Lachnospiraceae bacterium]|nr:transketolase [Lachnospiraceae bacterium]
MRTAYLNILHDLAEKDRRVFALLADNGIIVYDRFRQDFPEQFLNLGISESNMVAVAAGMANQGKIPFAYTIGAFLSFRALEFIKNDVCLQNQNVKLIGTGAGMSYSKLGPTHHTTEDLGVLRVLPNLQIITPASPMEVKKATLAAYEHTGPVYIRLGTNKEPEIYQEDYKFQIGKAVTLREGTDVTIISMGTILKDVINIAEQVEEENIKVRVINMHTVKPLDKEIIIKAVEETGKIITIEDHSMIGGVGSAVAEVIAEYGSPVKFIRMGLKGFSQGYGTYDQVRDSNGIGHVDLYRSIHNIIGG